MFSFKKNIVTFLILISVKSLSYSIELEFQNKVGGFGTGKGQFLNVSSISVFQSMLAIGDSHTNTVQVFTRSGQYLFKVDGITDDGEKIRFDSIQDVAQGNKGQLFVLDRENSRVYAFNRVAEFLYEFGSFGKGDQRFNDPEDLYVDKIGNIWISDSGNNRVVKLSDSGKFILSITPSDFSFLNPKKVELRANFSPVVLDKNGIHQFSDRGRYVSTLFSHESVHCFTFLNDIQLLLTFSDRKDVFLLDIQSRQIRPILGAVKGSQVYVNGEFLYLIQPGERSVWIYEILPD